MKKILLVLGTAALLLITGCFGGQIKGNITGHDKIYHLPGDPSYNRTKAEQMFNTEEEALKAGFRHVRNSK